MRIVRNTARILFLVAFAAVLVKGNMALWLALFIVSALLALFFGRFYCGWICPMNTVMISAERVSKKTGWQTKVVPRILTKKGLPWIVLFISILMMMVFKKTVQIDLPMLLVFLVLSVVVTLRFEPWVFHNHICPFSPILAMSSSKPHWTYRVDASNCIGCARCETVCPSKAVAVGEDRNARIESSLCHECGQCTEVCPRNVIAYSKKQNEKETTK